MGRRIVKYYKYPSVSDKDTKPPLSSLTPRELALVRLSQIRDKGQAPRQPLAHRRIAAASRNGHAFDSAGQLEPLEAPSSQYRLRTSSTTSSTADRGSCHSVTSVNSRPNCHLNRRLQSSRKGHGLDPAISPTPSNAFPQTASGPSAQVSTPFDLPSTSSAPRRRTVMATMVESRPTSAPSSEIDRFGLHHLAEYNRQAPAGQHKSGPDGGLYLRSGQQDAASHGMQQAMHSDSSDPFVGHHFDDQGYPSIHHEGLGIQFGTPRSSDFSFEDPSRIKDESLSPVQPQTPSDFVKRTRSGRAVGSRDSFSPGTPTILRSNTTGSKVTKSPRVKPPRQKSNNTKAPKIDRPLSELTEGMDKVPVKDMEAWVNRPDEVRHEEREKKNGYITRPMNSFMLYRSAYADRTKIWCSQNNHQIVSSVSGDSWPLEPQQVRNFYNELAKIERDNHARAFPDYKFQPSKNGPASRRKKEDLSDEEGSVVSAAGDGDAEWRPVGTRRSGRKSQARDDYSAGPYQTSFEQNGFNTRNGFHAQWDVQTAQDHFPGGIGTPGPYQTPYFQSQPQVTHQHQPHQLYQQHHQQYVMPGYTETQMPMQDQYYNMHSALPQEWHHDLSGSQAQPHHQQHHQQLFPEHPYLDGSYQDHQEQHAPLPLQVDPSLLEMNGQEPQHSAGFLNDPFMPNDFAHHEGTDWKF